MTQQQKQYIEQNIDLIENEDWDEFFQNAPDGIGGVLYEAGIEFTNNMIKIPDWLFYNSKIEDIIIPNSVTKIGDYSFAGCTCLTSVTIPDSVISIGSYAFSSCSSLESIKLPDSVTRISEGAFYDCKILKSVNFNGTIAEWREIGLSQDAFIATSVRKVICSDGIIDITELKIK